MAPVHSLNRFDRFLPRVHSFFFPPASLFFCLRRSVAFNLPVSFSLFFWFGSPEVYRRAYIVQPGLHVPSAFREQRHYCALRSVPPVLAHFDLSLPPPFLSRPPAFQHFSLFNIILLRFSIQILPDNKNSSFDLHREAVLEEPRTPLARLSLTIRIRWPEVNVAGEEEGQRRGVLGWRETRFMGGGCGNHTTSGDTH